MTDASSPRKARFHVGEPVRVVGPSIRARREDTGTVTEVIGSGADTVYRYRVTFADSSSETFFGFELELIEESPRAS